MGRARARAPRARSARRAGAGRRHRFASTKNWKASAPDQQAKGDGIELEVGFE